MMRIIVFSISIVILILCSILYLPFYTVLTFEKEDTGKVLAYTRLEDGAQFHIHFIHSIHKTPVIETYEVRNKSIVQQQISYEEFAVGMPSNVEGEGAFVIQDGHYMIVDMNRSFPHLDLRIAQIMPNHEIILGDKTIPLSNIASPGSWIRIQIRTISLWQKLKGVDLLE